MLVLVLSAAAALAWLGVLVLPSQPHRTRERLGPAPPSVSAPNLADITVLIPARDEAVHMATTLAALAHQGEGLRVIVIDDQSTDGTAAICTAMSASLALPRAETSATRAFPLSIRVLKGAELPAGWGGKVWALQQGLELVATRFTLLLDADIELAAGMVPALLEKARDTRAGLVSIMARLSTRGLWEKLLAPPFVFFFKLLYPFARVNAPDAKTAAAAGGCVLVETGALREVGGFAAIRGALIDDVALASRVKAQGFSLWLGLSDGVVSEREYRGLAAFWRMVSRTAFTELKYSLALLVLAALIMVWLFVFPFAALLWDTTPLVLVASATAVLAMAATYLPIVRFYGLPPIWSLTLPLAAALFLAMTVSSALNYWHGTRARWKSRDYAASGD